MVDAISYIHIDPKCRVSQATKSSFECNSLWLRRPTRHQYFQITAEDKNPDKSYRVLLGYNCVLTPVLANTSRSLLQI
jgi:hypothetical protein